MIHSHAAWICLQTKTYLKSWRIFAFRLSKVEVEVEAGCGAQCTESHWQSPRSAA